MAMPSDELTTVATLHHYRETLLERLGQFFYGDEPTQSECSYARQSVELQDKLKRPPSRPPSGDGSYIENPDL